MRSDYWEKFAAGPNLAKDVRWHVTIDKKNVIRMNRVVHKALGSPVAVALFFNKRHSMIGIVKADKDLKEAFPVVEHNGSFVVHARPLCKHYGIEIVGTQKFATPNFDEEGILRLDLSTTTRTTIRKRRTIAAT
ncbi:MAG: hypothetical protein JNL64_06805 [Blastocatellia bacterium]|nr:hypothetical protein [Blastocatellia bacterium]